jgi:hypothetical protein
MKIISVLITLLLVSCAPQAAPQTNPWTSRRQEIASSEERWKRIDSEVKSAIKGLEAIHKKTTLSGSVLPSDYTPTVISLGELLDLMKKGSASLLRMQQIGDNYYKSGGTSTVIFDKIYIARMEFYSDVEKAISKINSRISAMNRDSL